MNPVVRWLVAGAFCALPKRLLSRVLGRLAAHRFPGFLLRRAIALYVRAYGVDVGEAEVPAGGYPTFDAFFTRALRAGARPIHGGRNSVVVPADGLVLDVGGVDGGSRLVVKGRSHSLRELVGDATAGRLVGGCFVVIYLAPSDYHRVHAPVGGRVSTVHHVGGTLFPVNALGIAVTPRLFTRNERVVVVQEADAAGVVATVLVGALGVGRITTSFDPSVETGVGRTPTTKHYPEEDAPHVRRGEELGVFHMGSTVIVVAGPRIPWAIAVSAGDRVRVGQLLAGPVVAGTGEPTADAE